MCSSQNETKIPTPTKKYTLEELSDGMKRLSDNIKKVLLPDKPKKLRDLSEHTFKDTHYKKTILTQIEKVKIKTLWKKFWED